MAFKKLIYVDGETVIPAKNLNDIQDELIRQAEEKNTPIATSTVPGKVAPSAADFTVSNTGALSALIHMAVVTALPEDPDPNTLYLVVPWEEPVADGDTLAVSQVYRARESSEYLEVE